MFKLRRIFFIMNLYAQVSIFTKIICIWKKQLFLKEVRWNVYL